MLIATYWQYRPKGHRESQKEVGSLSPSEHLSVLLTFQIVYQGQGQHENSTWKDLWNLLIITIKLKYKYFHNSMD